MKLFRRSALLALALGLAFALPSLSPLIAQTAPAAQSVQAAAPAPSSAAKRAMDIEDVIAYRGMGATVLSNDGKWFAYRMSPTEGDSELIVRATDSDKEMKFPVGAGAGGTMVFSEDSQWLAFSTSDVNVTLTMSGGDQVVPSYTRSSKL